MWLIALMSQSFLHPFDKGAIVEVSYKHKKSSSSKSYRKSYTRSKKSKYKKNTYQSCPPDRPIKGNISKKGERIYHTPSSKYYNRTKPEACFATEEEARKAGYRKAR